MFQFMKISKLMGFLSILFLVSCFVKYRRLNGCFGFLNKTRSFDVDIFFNVIECHHQHQQTARVKLTAMSTIPSQFVRIQTIQAMGDKTIAVGRVGGLIGGLEVQERRHEATMSSGRKNHFSICLFICVTSLDLT